MKFHRLGDSRQEIKAALALREVAGVLVETTACGPAAQQLAAVGFVSLPRVMQTLVDVEQSAVGQRRPFRRNLGSSLAAWSQAGCQLELKPAHEWPRDIVDRLYFEVLVPSLYARGRSPFGTHNYEAFFRLFDDQAWMALVTCESRIVGGGLLTARPSPPWAVLAGIAGPGRVLTGQVYALAASLADGRRAFIHSLLRAASERGFAHLSLGEDHAWMQAPYARVVVEKLEWASAVVFERDTRVLLASFESCGEDILYFRRAGTGLELCAPPSLKGLSKRLTARIVRLIEQTPHDRQALAS